MNSETVLVVREDGVGLDHCCSVLEQNGYQVLRATSMRQALEVWSRNSQMIDLALVDPVMPGMTGLELAEPTPAASTPSGSPKQVKALMANEADTYHVFWKPFDLTIFLQMTSNLQAKPACGAR